MLLLEPDSKLFVVRVDWGRRRRPLFMHMQSMCITFWQPRKLLRFSWRHNFNSFLFLASTFSSHYVKKCIIPPFVCQNYSHWSHRLQAPVLETFREHLAIKSCSFQWMSLVTFDNVLQRTRAGSFGVKEVFCPSHEYVIGLFHCSAFQKM